MIKKILAMLVIIFCATASISAVSQQATELGVEFAVTPPNNEEQPTENTPTIDTEEDTPVVLETMEMKPDETGRRPWLPPNYEAQQNIEGYNKDTFSVPPELKPQVDFWIKIFTQFSTDQGVLHDSRYINLVYAELDFTKIENYSNLNPVQRQRAREKLVKDKKKEIVERLTRLNQLKSAEGLEGEDLRYWSMFETVEEANKFLDASKKGRLRFQLGQSDRFLQGIYYSGRYLTKMEQIFREAGLPIELTRLPFVESSFNLKARSKVGASGIWQFMRYTGRMYMKVNYLVDERNEPILATHAAAKLLRFNHNLLNSWPLAVTAYNFGPSGMKREKDKLKTDNLAEIIKRSTNRRLGFASGNFYASFLAALEVEKNAGKYFKNAEWSQELQFDEITLPKNVRYAQLLEHFGGDRERAALYNPHFSHVVQKGHVAIPKGSKIRVPHSSSERFLASIEKKPNSPQEKAASETLKTGITQYQIARGDTLSGIAREFGVSVGDLKEINNIHDPRSIRAGQVLTIPVVGQ